STRQGCGFTTAATWICSSPSPISGLSQSGRRRPRPRSGTAIGKTPTRPTIRERTMIDLPYSLVIEEAQDDYFGFYSPELEGFSGIGHSLEDCLAQARVGMQEHVELLTQQGLPVPPGNPHPTVLIHNERKDAGEGPKSS